MKVVNRFVVSYNSHVHARFTLIVFFLAASALAQSAPSPCPAERPIDDIIAEAEDHPRAADRCAWCGKHEEQVKKLLGRNATALCNECVSLACDIFEAELGSGWR